jgi:hypothetical protein
MDMLKQQCVQAVAANVTLYSAEDDADSPIGELLRTIESNLCVEDCGAHGDCVDGKTDLKLLARCRHAEEADRCKSLSALSTVTENDGRKLNTAVGRELYGISA